MHYWIQNALKETLEHYLLDINIIDIYKKI